jgi:hypothetical protein
VAASVVAVIDITAKVAALCFGYLEQAKGAKPDIERLVQELVRLRTILEHSQQLLKSPGAARLQASQDLRHGLQGCFVQLEELRCSLKEKHDGGPLPKVMKTLGIRALKWPFERKRVDNIIAALEQYRRALSEALIVDQAYGSPGPARFSWTNIRTVPKFLILVRTLFFPSSQSPNARALIHMRRNTMRDAIPRLGLPFVGRSRDGPMTQMVSVSSG